MNRFNWTYVDNNGIPHNVGVMHGAESGNLLIYCDSNIIHIRFKIFDSTSLTFFIEEELCELSIEKVDDNFLYGFTIDKEADTPLNRRRKTLDRKYFRQTVAAASIFLAFTFSVILGVLVANKNNDTAKALRNSETNAKVFLTSDNGKSAFTYHFVANGKTHKMEKVLENNDHLISENGMPLEDGDEFTVKYTRSNPARNQIDHNKPSLRQITKYHHRASAQHLKFHPKLTEEFCDCYVKQAYTYGGLNGLANVYFQQTDLENNAKHNRDAYQKMKDDPNFAEKIKTNCDK